MLISAESSYLPWSDALKFFPRYPLWSIEVLAKVHPEGIMTLREELFIEKSYKHMTYDSKQFRFYCWNYRCFCCIINAGFILRWMLYGFMGLKLLGADF